MLSKQRLGVDRALLLKIIIIETLIGTFIGIAWLRYDVVIAISYLEHLDLHINAYCKYCLFRNSIGIPAQVLKKAG